MLKKTVVIATLGAAVAGMGFASRADAADPVLGALIGGGIGAAIGHDSNRRHGGAVGGVVGALIGSSIASSSNHYYGGRYYDDRYSDNRYYDNRYYDNRYYEPAPAYRAYYAPEPVYYAPAPAYYAPTFGTTIVYSSGPSYRYRHGYRDHHWHDGPRYR